MPQAVAAGIASTALTAPVVGGLTTALGTGLAAGIAAGGGGGLLGSLGLSPIGTGLGGLAPGVAANIAPAAASQLAGTIGAGAIPGIQGGMGALGGAGTAGAAQGAASGLASMANPTLAQQIAQQQTVANAARQNLLAQSGGTDIMGAATQRAAASPYDLSAGFKQGLDPTRALQTPSLANPTAAQVNPADIVGRSIRPDQNFMQNLGNIGSFQDVKDYAVQHPYATSAAVGLGTMGLTKMMQGNKVEAPESNAMIRPYTYERTQRPEAYAVSPTVDSSERMYFNDQYVAGEPYRAAEGGITAAYAMGGPVEQMSAMNAIGANTGYPMANLQTPMYSNPAMQTPEATNVVAPSADAGVGAYTGEQRFSNGGPAFAGPAFMGPVGSGYVGAGNYIENARLPGSNAPRPGGSDAPLPKYSYDPTTLQFTQLGGSNKVSGGIAAANKAPALVMPQMQSQQAAPINIPAYQSPEQQLGLEGFYDMMNQRLAGYGGYGGFAAGGGVGGEPNLGGYSDGGRLLKGPGDGVSDSIPASIGGRQPARLADGEFVVPARIVSELGNGSTEAGARKLYAMMDRVQKSRKKSVGKGKVAVDSKASKHLPA